MFLVTLYMLSARFEKEWLRKTGSCSQSCCVKGLYFCILPIPTGIYVATAPFHRSVCDVVCAYMADEQYTNTTLIPHILTFISKWPIQITKEKQLNHDMKFKDYIYHGCILYIYMHIRYIRLHYLWQFTEYQVRNNFYSHDRWAEMGFSQTSITYLMESQVFTGRSF